MTIKRQRRGRAELWTLLTTVPTDNPSPDYYISLAQKAEQLKLHGIVLLDTLLEPSVFIAGIGDQTSQIGLAIGYTTEGEHPYLQARKFSSLDEFTKGRFGWANAPGLGFSEEYFLVFSELLLSSWRDDALLKNKKTGQWINTDRLRQIDFNGDTYEVPGPALSKPTPQRYPVIISLDTDTDGARRHAAKYSEVVSVRGDKRQVAYIINEIRRLAQTEFKRSRESIKFVAHVFLSVIGDSSAPIADFKTISGTAKSIADELEGWVASTGVSGFNFQGTNIEEWATVVEELQSRGHAQETYATEASTFRGNITGGYTFLKYDHPLYHYRWFTHQSQDEFEGVLKKAQKLVTASPTGYHH